MADKPVMNKPLIGITLDMDGEYLRMKHQYSLAVHKAGGVPLLLPPESDAAGQAAEILDGLLIPGGADINPSYYSEEVHSSVRVISKERTDFEIALLKAIMKQRKPVLGICYGMQLINVALGGSLYQDIESQIKGSLDHRNGTHKINLIQALIPDCFNSSFILHPSSLVVNSSHHQAVKKMGQGLEACAFADDNIVEAVTMPDYPFLLGVQWHPERMDDGLSLDLFSKFMESAYAHK